MKLARIGLVVFALSLSVLGATPASAEDGVIEEGVVSATDSSCNHGWCVVVQAKGSGVISGGQLRTVFACSAHATPMIGVPSTVPAATQVTECYMKTGLPNQTDSKGRTLPGNSAAVHAQENLSAFASPIQVCVSGKVILENNAEVAVGVTCSLV